MFMGDSHFSERRVCSGRFFFLAPERASFRFTSYTATLRFALRSPLKLPWFDHPSAGRFGAKP